MEKNEVKLERKLSTPNVLALAFGCIIGWSTFILPGISFLKKAGTLRTCNRDVCGCFSYDNYCGKYPLKGLIVPSEKKPIFVLECG